MRGLGLLAICDMLDRQVVGCMLVSSYYKGICAGGIMGDHSQTDRCSFFVPFFI
jgi:hypothetical protein